MTLPMTRAAREVCEAATPGPWIQGGPECPAFVLDDEGEQICSTADPTLYPYASVGANATFIAAAREGWPAALDRIEELEAQAERLRGYHAEAVLSGGRIIDERDAALAEVARLRAENEEMSRQSMDDFYKYKQRRNEQFAAYERLRIHTAAYLLDRADQYETDSPCWVALADAAENVMLGEVETAADNGDFDEDLLARVRSMRSRTPRPVDPKLGVEP